MTSMREPLVSVVTPVYNGEAYLKECIESVLAQTYSNYEYLIVDNCSTDDSQRIAAEYSEMDPRIRVLINEHHLSMLPNWNQALKRIAPDSKYCKIVHADDWIFPECLARMVETAEANPNVGIVSSYRLEEDKVSCCGLPWSTKVLPGREVCRRRFLTGEHLFGTPTTILIRSDLIWAREHFYNEENIHADTEVCFDLLSDSDFGFVHQVLSFTRRWNETNTTFCRNFNTFLPCELMILKKWGRRYLSEEEYDQVWARMMKAYYRYLGRRIFDRRDKSFWDYHRGALEKLGCALSYSRVLSASFIIAFNRTLEALKYKR